MSPSVVYVMCRSESMTHRDIMPVNPFITFSKACRTQYIERRDNNPVQVHNHRRRRQQEWRQNQLFVSLSLGGIQKAERSL